MSSPSLWSLSSQPLIPGNVADADLVLLGAQKARLYFQNSSLDGAIGPFVSKVFSALTLDSGKTWSLEPGIRLQGVSGIEVERVSDGTFKAYAQENQQTLVSASSKDGLTWTLDSGARITDDNVETPPLDRIGFPTVAQIADGSWIMVYEGKYNGAYPSNTLPGADETMNLYWATSADGLAWIKRGIAVDSRNEFFKGEVQHGRLIQNQEGGWDLYFWVSAAITPPGAPYVNNTGIYRVKVIEGGFSKDAVCVLPGASRVVPSDPAGALWEGSLHLYHGIGPMQAKTQGIYQALGQTADTSQVISRSQLWVGTSESEEFSGGGGWNSFNGYGGNDVYRGGNQTDSVVFNSERVSYSILATPDSIQITDTSGADGVDMLISIERLKFSDVSLALDLDGNAGQVAKLLGAVFGKGAVSEKEKVGIGLALLDGGMGYQDLAALAVSAAKANTSTDICTLLWTNVFGKAPTAADIAPFKQMLDSGQISVGALTTLAADTSYNTTNIDLVGLSQTGIEYV